MGAFAGGSESLSLSALNFPPAASSVLSAGSAPSVISPPEQKMHVIFKMQNDVKKKQQTKHSYYMLSCQNSIINSTFYNGSGSFMTEEISLFPGSLPWFPFPTHTLTSMHRDKQPT